VRQQPVHLIRRKALPIEAERFTAYLAATERVVGAASRETLQREFPAHWFDESLLEGPPLSVEQLIDALQPEPIATRDMIAWLSSGFEFGKPPSSISLWDRRVIPWPPTDDVRELFLFRYEYPPAAAGDEVRRGVGLVGGSTTFSMFGKGAPSVDGTVEDALAAHCVLELDLIGDSRGEGRTLEVGRALLGFTSTPL